VQVTIDEQWVIDVNKARESKSFAPLLKLLDSVKDFDQTYTIVAFMVHEMSKTDSKWKGFFGALSV
jgi:hypothetical protein